MAVRPKSHKLEADDILCDPKTSKIGSGGFGVVHRGVHPVLGDVAVKVIQVNPDQIDGIRSSFAEEMDMLEKANHENIANVHGWVQWNSNLGLVMQYYDGGTLWTLVLRQDVPLSPLLRLNIALDVADSLVYMHESFDDNRMIHGDLKPDNVLLNKYLQCKLADFGSAKLAPHTRRANQVGVPQSPQTPAQTKALTVCYAAPEVLKNPGLPPKRQQDTFSYGIMVHTLLSRKAPYRLNSELAIKDAVIKGQRPNCEGIEKYKRTLCGLDLEVIKVLQSQMKACWHPDPSERPDMIQVRDQLKQLHSKFSTHHLLEQSTEVIRVLNISPPPRGNTPLSSLPTDSGISSPAEETVVSSLSEASTSTPTATAQGEYIANRATPSPQASWERIPSIDTTPSLRDQIDMLNAAQVDTTGPVVNIIRRESLVFEEQFFEDLFGKTYEGMWDGSKQVAIKQLEIGAKSARAFLAEVKMMSTLRHENVIVFHGVVPYEPNCIVTEYMCHGNLLEYLKSENGRQLSLVDHINMAAQIATGMAYIETMNYIHRDLRAGKIWVGENLICKIADFGMAKQTVDGMYTAKMGVKYAAKWAAPESVKYGESSIKSDVWSFGVLLTELVTNGREPYPLITIHEVYENVVNGYRMQQPPDCPDSLYELMRLCWDKSPKQRPNFEYIQGFLDKYFTVIEPEYNGTVLTTPSV